MTRGDIGGAGRELRIVDAFHLKRGKDRAKFPPLRRQVADQDCRLLVGLDCILPRKTNFCRCHAKPLGLLFPPARLALGRGYFWG